MVDIHKQQLYVGDYVLVAFASCGTCGMEYATIIEEIDGYCVRVRMETHLNSGYKTKTVNLSNSKILKMKKDG